MPLRKSPVRYALAIAVLGVLVTIVNVFLLFTYPEQFLSEAARTQYLDTWFQPVASIGGSIVYYGIPLLAAVGGFFYLQGKQATVRKVLVGFAIGGLVFGIGTVVVGWIVTHPQLRGTVLVYVGGTVRATIRFLGAAGIGVLASWLLDNRRGRVAPTTD